MMALSPTLLRPCESHGQGVHQMGILRSKASCSRLYIWRSSLRLQEGIQSLRTLIHSVSISRASEGKADVTSLIDIRARDFMKDCSVLILVKVSGFSPESHSNYSFTVNLLDSG